MSYRPMLLFVIVAVSAISSCRSAAPPPKAVALDNAEVAALCDADQADRRPAGGKSIDWSVVSPRDRTREARVLAIYRANALHTGADYFHAALVLQHSEDAHIHLLAHEMSVVAISKGERKAIWLAAAAEDRFLMNIGEPQRFGTQYRSDGPNTPMQLWVVDPAVTDQLRREMKVLPSTGK